jgi:hypothetical protein
MARHRTGGVVLEDGPCAGDYSVRRAPHFLRAVLHASGATDLLDQLNDVPLETEAVCVYEALPGTIFDPDTLARTGTFLCPPPAASGRYRHRTDVDGEQVRATGAWRAWARSQPASVPLLDGVTLERREATVP